MAEASSSSSSNDIVHSSLSAPDRSRHVGDNTPTTPTPNVRFSQHPPAEIDNPIDDSAPETPTRHSFAGVRGQRALPEDPPSAHGTERTKREELSLKRGSSNRSTVSGCSDDVEMGEGDAEEGAEDDGSDNDSVTSDSQRPSKKKKGQRFFCTEFPPCQLSFTRSEHLARHIRKHTGERPFQCHCSRRFSRLDNLRQHAQTVHVNEDIPGDSLAATSTRFQRQIRTDRVRPPGNGRPRSSTMTSQGGSHGRGHSRNLSASSIGSTASSMGIPEDLRRRPPPLAMANDPNKRGMMSVDTYNPVTGSPSQQYAYFPQSPSGFSTPTSTTFSTGPTSPGFTSPPSSISRSSFYNGARHGRRLSVPSGANPYQNNAYPPPYYSPMPATVNLAYSQQSSVYASPTSSVFSHGRRDSESELEFRRRTWHSGTYPGYTQRPATSGLMYGQTPDEPRPAMSQQSAASQVTRLPGIESFDHAPPSAARAPASSPMMIESEPRPHSSGRPSDAGLHQNLTRLDITSANAPPPDGQWQTSHAAPPHHGYFIQQSGGMPPQIIQAPPPPHHEQPSTPRRTKRQAWYGGPVGPVTFGRPSPEDSGSSDGVPTPLTQQGGEFHPVIISQHEPYPVHAPAAIPVGGPDNQHKVQQTSYPRSSVQQQSQQDKPEPTRADSGFQSFAPVTGHMQAAQQHTYALQAGHDPRFASGYMQAPNHPEQRNDMGRLEALVAVATSENRAVENRN